MNRSPLAAVFIWGGSVYFTVRRVLVCVFALTMVGCLMSCGEGAGTGDVGVVPTLATHSLPMTTPSLPSPVPSPTPAVVVSSPAPAQDGVGGSSPMFLAHGEPPLINRGHNYVYGELRLLGDCLRVSYLDSSRLDQTRDGLLLVWPADFSVRVRGDVVEVVDAADVVVASVGQNLRISGRHVSETSSRVVEWDWVDDATAKCSGPYWMVGDEVTAVARGSSGVDSNSAIFFPRLPHQRGPILRPLEGMPGTLALRDGCLFLEVDWPPGKYFIVWPPGFNVDEVGDEIVVVNGGGNVMARVGDEIVLGGRSGPDGVSYSVECPGDYYNAYSVKLQSP